MGKGNNLLLRPLSLIFGLLTGFRNLLYNRGILPSRKFEIPVICVGNITVGGTGKTPHTEYLVSLLRKDFGVAVLSRGYKRRSSGFRLVTPQSSASEAGDEPLQIARKYPDICVAVDRKRVHGVEMITGQCASVELIILDDAFQHRKITPGYSILLTDYDRLMTRDHILPYGNLRESIKNISRADVIIVTKTPSAISEENKKLIVSEISGYSNCRIFFTGLSYKDPLPLFDGSPSLRLSGRKGPGILLVTGIANPSHVLDYLKSFTDELLHLSFADHHSFSAGDIEKITRIYNEMKSGRKIIVTTEKDAVRLREFANIAEPVRSSLYYLPVEVFFLNDGKIEFDKMITGYAGRNKGNM
ncbi:MAG TPA: tetraacyldisaccharide 4'-kinase [Bacteroidales bacterium]|nr:tetraacyldisaccharide 4'-kinase [Bacteroidales bacterium]